MKYSVTIVSFTRDKDVSTKTQDLATYNDVARYLEGFLQSLQGGIKQFLSGIPYVVRNNNDTHVIQIVNNESGKRSKMPRSLRDGGTKWVDPDIAEERNEIEDDNVPTIYLNKDGTLDGITGIEKIRVMQKN